MRYLRLTLEYDGTGFSGWQKQTGCGLRTVQGVLENALETLTGERIRIFGAGRTDAGVHALGQVAHFAAVTGIPADRFPAAMNGLLPPDVVIKEGAEVNGSFHARFTACAKQYRYLILNRRYPSAIWRNYCHHVPQRLDRKAIEEAARYFVGRQDFLAFSATGSNAKTSVRNIFACQVSQADDWVMFTVTADGFLYKMMRLMAGTLLEVGLGRFPPGKVREILTSKTRGRGGSALPSRGLYLLRVYYPGEEMYLAGAQKFIGPGLSGGFT